MFKKIIKITMSLIFECLVLWIFYLYSHHNSFFPWGSSTEDGLYLIAIPYIALPLIFLLSIFKFFILKKYNLIKLSYILHFIILTISFLIFNYSMDSSFVSVFCLITSGLIAIVNFYELIYLFKKNI